MLIGAVAVLATTFHVYAGVTQTLADILAECAPILNGEVVVEQVEDDNVVEPDQRVLKAIYQHNYSELNEEIYNIRVNPDLTDRQKVYRVGKIFEKNLDNIQINYIFGDKITDPDTYWKELDDELLEGGISYHDGMSMDCSGFIQYLYYISTGKIVPPNTTYQVKLSNEITREKGAIGYTFGPNDADTASEHHCAVWLGNNTYLDCSESYGGLRLKDITDNEFWENYMVYFGELDDWTSIDISTID